MRECYPNLLKFVILYLLIYTKINLTLKLFTFIRVKMS